MSFYKRYELDRLIADGDAKTFRALDTEQRRPVLLHMFNPSGQAVLAVLKSKLARDPARPIAPLLELGEFAGSPYAVTEEIAGFRDIRGWLASLPETLPETIPQTPVQTPRPPRPSELRAPSHAGSATERFNQLFDNQPPLPQYPVAPKAAPPSPPAPPQQQMGEFTRAFGVPTPQRSPSPPASQEPSEFTRLFGGSPAGPPPVSPSAPPPQTSSGPGEFTQVFKLQQQANPRPVGPPPAPSPKTQSKSGDDFERMFGPTPAAAPAPVESNERERGQFTGFFGMGQAGESINIEEEQARAARRAPEVRPFQAPSEFTRVFGPEDGGRLPQPPAGPRTVGSVGSASRLFGDPHDLQKLAQRDTPSQTQTGPGEYTRIIAARKPDTAAGSQATAAPAAKRNWVLWLAIGLPVLVLIVIAIVAAMRSG